MNKEGPKGSIVRILSNEDIIIDLGKSDGLEEGDHVAILSGEPLAVRGEGKGKILSFKNTLLITECSEHLSIASTYKLRTVNRGGMGLGGLSTPSEFYRLSQPPRYEEVVETLKIAPGHDQPVEGADEPICRGDSVIKVSSAQADRGFILLD